MKVRYTVPSEDSRAAYAGNGSTTVFSVPFVFFDNTDLRVTLVNTTTDVETVQTITTHYSVTGGSGSTGSITMVTAPASGNTLVIERDLPLTQEIDYQQNDGFPADTNEEGLDRAMMAAQQNAREIAKSPKLPPTYDPEGDEIRIPVPEAGKVLVGNDDEDGWENTAIADLDVADIPTTLTSLANRDLLEYESAGAVWKNQTLATVLGRLLTTAGDLLRRGASGVERLAVGSAGQYLGVSGGYPTWLNLDQRRAIADAAATVAATDRLLVYTSLSASRTVTLPAASAFNAGQSVAIVDGSGSASQTVALSVAPNGTDTIAGSNTTQVCVNVPRGRCVLVSNGSNGWDVLQWSVVYTAALSEDVNMNNTSNYFDGPSVAQGTVGTWLVTGAVAVLDTSGAARLWAKMWDGTTTFASAPTVTPAASQPNTLHLSGRISAPAGNLRISGRDPDTTSGVIKFNVTGNSADSYIRAERIA